MSTANRSGETRKPKRWAFVLAVAVVLGGLVTFVISQRHSKLFGAGHLEEPAPRLGKEPSSAYGGSASCQECHQEEYRQWAESHHGLAERNPDPTLDEVAFTPGKLLKIGSAPASCEKTTAGYAILASGIFGTQQVFQVQRVIGHLPLRQFLVEFGNGRLQAVEAAFDPRTNVWFDIFGQENRRPGEWGHWTGRGMNWNSMCASCHNTRLRKNYSEQKDGYSTTMVERAVGCEACHGPLQAHLDWQRQFGKSGRVDPTLPRLSPSRTTDNCGFCHSRRVDLTGDFKPGDDFLDQMSPVIVDASETFYADGQVRDEDYEYAAFLGSRMHMRGVRCADCHNPHSGKTLLPGNWLCMRCHNGSYTNAPVIDPVAHSHHKVFGFDSSGQLMNSDLTQYHPDQVRETGGECVNCHMPQTAYMQRHRRHDHGFTTPDPLLTKAAGIPNACNRCHDDKNSDWAVKYCQDWYGNKMDRPSRRRALLIAAARKNESNAKPGLLELMATNDIPYWRAVAAGLLGEWSDDARVREQLIETLDDTNALVRLECVHALEPLVSFDEVASALRKRLQDPARAVRVATAWAMRQDLDLSSRAGVDLANFLALGSDQPGGQMQAGAFAMARGNPSLAAQHYQKAIQWDPNSAAGRHDYAVVLSSLNRPQDALEQLQAACRLEPTNADFCFKLALAWNEIGQTDKTIASLKDAVRLDPSHSKAWYNLGLALSSTGQTEQAVQALVRAEAADPSDPRIPYARATILARLGSTEEARAAARKALAVDPRFAPAVELLRSLQ